MVDRSLGRLGLSMRADSPETCSRKSSSPLRISSGFKCSVTLCATAAPAELASRSGACAGATAVPAGEVGATQGPALQEFRLRLRHDTCRPRCNLCGNVALPGFPTDALRKQLRLLPGGVHTRTTLESHASWRQNDQLLGGTAHT